MRPWSLPGSARLPLLAAVLLVAVLLVAAGACGGPPAPRAAAGCPKAFVPAYFYPGPAWQDALGSKPPPDFMILDITSSGAGNSPDRNYQAAASRAKAAGVRVLGYSNTQYSDRPAAAVLADVRHYRSWYGVTSIFLDQVSSGPGELAYYRSLAGYIHGQSPGSTVMLNPGMYPSRAYLSVGNVLLVFEGTYASYLRLRVPGWARHYPASRFAESIYATPGSDLGSAIALARQRRAGYVYVTSGTGPNPYAALPAYWPAEDAAITTGCAGLPVSAAARRAAR